MSSPVIQVPRTEPGKSINPEVRVNTGSHGAYRAKADRKSPDPRYDIMLAE